MKKIFEKLESFFGLGNLKIGVFNPEKEAVWPSSPERVAYLKAMNASGCHIFCKPEKEARFMLVDDITIDILNAHHKKNGRWKTGRMIVETSTGNYQAWIKSSRDLETSEKKHWLKKMHNDPGAAPVNRWGRCPGFRNRKDKYFQTGIGYPLAKLIWVDWFREAVIPKVPDAQPQRQNVLTFPSPQGGACVNNISRSDYNKGDESATDFAYVLALMRRGMDDGEIHTRLLAEREDWKNHKGERRMNAYINRTLDKARQIISAA